MRICTTSTNFITILAQHFNSHSYLIYLGKYVIISLGVLYYNSNRKNETDKKLSGNYKTCMNAYAHKIKYMKLKQGSEETSRR
jgi:hypothetical protein